MTSFKIELQELKRIINNSNYLHDGDEHEREFGFLLSDKFPNHELFWKTFIVIYTNRIDENIANSNEKIMPRVGVSPELQSIFAYHYSLFVDLVHAFEHYKNFKEPDTSGLKVIKSSFEDFYYHLGTVCDLVEEFLTKIYLQLCTCKNVAIECLKSLSKEEFINIAETWYLKNYSDLYDHYLKKGKSIPIRIPSRKNIIKEFFENNNSLKEYNSFSQKIREYRNIITHNVEIGTFIIDGIHYAPKNEKIKDYTNWNEFYLAYNNPEKFKRDFVLKENLMENAFNGLLSNLNNLWEKPIHEMNKLIFENQNENLLIKYNLEFIK